MALGGSTVGSVSRLDAESAKWVAALGGAGSEREAALARLHGMLLRVARGELGRRAVRIGGAERDDLAHQAADDALLGIVRKLGLFRGESRFTTWAHRFVVLEVSAKLARLRRQIAVPVGADDPDRLADDADADPARESERRELVAALRRAIEEGLTARQRRVFVAVILEQVPADSLAAELDSSRSAIHKALFDARRKLRATLVAGGHLEQSTPAG